MKRSFKQFVKEILPGAKEVKVFPEPLVEKLERIQILYDLYKIFKRQNKEYLAKSIQTHALEEIELVKIWINKVGEVYEESKKIGEAYENSEKNGRRGATN